MNKHHKIILVHPDKQHSFRTATALLNEDCLEKYITTVYNKPGSWTGLCTKLIRGAFKTKLQAHRSPDLPDEKVRQFTEFLSLILLVLARVDKSKKIYSVLKIYRDTVFNKKVARYCKKNCIDVVISFDVLSAQLYEELDRLGVRIVKILDMSAPYFPYMYNVFKQESQQCSVSQLNKVLETRLFDYWHSQAEKEVVAADGFLAASDFTKKSLIESGVDANKVYKCTYGAELSFLEAPRPMRSENDRFHCIYVGNITEQKGCRYLLETIKAAENENITFSLAGAYSLDNPIVKECYQRANFLGYLSKPDLIKHLCNSQVMIFPSLSDGFGFAVLEAMSCGVVPICSANAGVSDLIKHNETGFVVDAMDSNAIYAHLMKLYSDPELLHQMSDAARKSLTGVTWDNYYQDVIRSLSDVLEKQASKST